jgi:nicotinate-nucleotide adenylyltransferase
LRLAIFGGTFDPIHKAHQAVAAAAASQFRLDRVLFVPAARPPHKSGVTYAPYEHRVRMAELACAGFPGFEVSRLEGHPGRSYSIHTINQVRASLAPGDEVFFLIGADAFAEIGTWHRWREVVHSVRFIVVSRPGHPYTIPDGAQVERLETVDLPISSSDIRSALAAGQRPVEIPDSVFEYIVQSGLYGVPQPNTAQ